MKNFNYKSYLTLFLWTILLTGCEQISKTDPMLNKGINPSNLTFDTSSIAIIGFDQSTYSLFNSNYKPADLTQADISEIERLFNKSVADYNSKIKQPYKKYYSVDLARRKYKRQYISVINKKGEKEIYINCFCERFDNN